MNRLRPNPVCPPVGTSASSIRRGPWLCVPPSRAVCPWRPVNGPLVSRLIGLRPAVLNRGGTYDLRARPQLVQQRARLARCSSLLREARPVSRTGAAEGKAFHSDRMRCQQRTAGERQEGGVGRGVTFAARAQPSEVVQ